MRCKEENNKNTHITCRHNKSPQNYHIHTGFTLNSYLIDGLI